MDFKDAMHIIARVTPHLSIREANDLAVAFSSVLNCRTALLY